MDEKSSLWSASAGGFRGLLKSIIIGERIFRGLWNCAIINRDTLSEGKRKKRYAQGGEGEYYSLEPDIGHTRTTALEENDLRRRGQIARGGRARSSRET